MSCILIVEDQEISRKFLQTILYESEDTLEILQAGTIKEAIHLIKNHSIDLFFLDIELPDGSGLTLAKKIRLLSKYKLTWIIFTTTHMQFMLEAFKSIHCYDYLLKPFTKEQVLQISKILLQSIPSKLTEQQKKKPYLILNLKGLELKIYTDEILFIEVTGRTCTFHTKIQKYAVPYLTFKKLLKMIPPNTLIQSHRSFVINPLWIRSIDKAYLSWVIAFENYAEVAYVGKQFRNDVEESLLFIKEIPKERIL
jgi:DNA-binding LytR/AlgR family response regulator